MAYDTKAQEFVYGFFARGWSKERSMPEIRKVYPGFAGSTWDEWVKRFDWPARRATADAKLREFDDLCRDTARLLMLELNEIREKLLAQIRGGQTDTQTVYAYNSTAKQIAALSEMHLAERDNDRIALGVLSQAFDEFVSGLRDLDGLGPALERNAGAIGELVTAVSEKYGRAA